MYTTGTFECMIQKRSRESTGLTVLHGIWPEHMGGRVRLPSSLPWGQQ